MTPPPDPVADLTRQVATLTTQLDAMRKRFDDTAPSGGSRSSADSQHRPRLKLDVPRFDGTDTHGWIFKISQFFTYHQTPDEERITIASFYLDGPALAWYQWMYRNRQIASWDQFLKKLEIRFAPTAFDDPRGKLFKLTQSSSVTAYLTEFEALANCLEGLSEADLLSCFISGLKIEVRREVLAQQPTTISQAAGLARLQEDKLQDIARSSRPRSSPPPWHSTFGSRPSPKPNSDPPSTATSSQGLLPTPPAKPRFRHLSGAELDDRRSRGLCFNCDQPWSKQHKCGARLFLMVATDDDFSSVTGDLEAAAAELVDGGVTLEDTSIHAAQLSLHALSGDQAADTFRLSGRISLEPVDVLVDGGSTHNFIKETIAAALGLKLSPIDPFRVLVGSGQELLCSHICQGVSIVMQGHSFSMDLFVLGLRGADVVLGAQWLKRLGPVLMNYNSLTMTFFHNNTCVELKGDSPTPTVGLHHFQRLTRLDPEAQLFSLHITSPYDTPTQPTPTHSPSLPDTDHLDPNFISLLSKHSHLFTEPSTLPPYRPTDHTIPLLPQSTPVNVRPYRYPHSQKLEIESQVAKFLKTGWIQPSTSPFSSPVLLLKKKDGSWRMCVDYRALNAITVPDRFPLPTIDELLDELGGARVFSKLDLTSGFHQIRLAPGDVPKTAFRTHDGHYEYRVMSFGLCNAPATFQATMNDIFRELLRKFLIVFFDDILVFSSSLDTYLDHLTQVFTILANHKFHLKPTKCSFCQSQIAYLGHIVSEGTVAPDPLKIQGVVDWPTPKSVKSLRGFLGLSGFYRKFVQGYATLAHPLTSLLKKNSFEWSDLAQQAFDKLKVALATAPVLMLPDFSLPFTVQTDASGYAMGAVLLQNEHPIAYFSKLFCPRLSKASTYIRELHAITCAVKRWRQYLLGHYFIIQTDHRSLKELLTQVIQTPEQQFYLSKLLGYHYDIQYKPGKTNTVADALSRCQEPHVAELNVLSTPQFLFIDDLRKELSSDVDYQTKCQQVAVDPSLAPDYTVSNGLLLHKGRIWIPSTSRFKALLLKEFHETPIGGHAGVVKTLKRLSANFCWPAMRQDIK